MSAFSAGVLVGLLVALAEGLRAPQRTADTTAAPRAPGASSPTQIPARGWRSAFTASVREFGQDRIPAAAAAVTFYFLLALFPALSAFVSLYGLVANIEDARRLVLGLHGFVPGGAVSVLQAELARLAAADHGALGLAFVVSLLFSIWSANAGLKALIAGLNVAYETREKRGLIGLNLIALAFTAGVILTAIAGVAVIVAAPHLLASFGLRRLTGLALLRWPIALGAVGVMFSVLYRFGPSRPQAKWRWITPGSLLAAMGWMIMSALFSWYVANFGRFDKTYGSLGAIVGFLTWVWLSLMVLLLGGELNSELEKQVSQP